MLRDLIVIKDLEEKFYSKTKITDNSSKKINLTRLIISGYIQDSYIKCSQYHKHHQYNHN